MHGGPGHNTGGLTLACIIQETQGSSYPVGSTRSCWNTTILPLHNWSSMAGRDWWLLVTAIPCSWLAWVNPSSWPTNSNQGSTIRGGYNQHTQKAHLKYPPWVIGEAVPLDPTGSSYIRPCSQVRESQQLYLIHTNKCREVAKIRR